MECGTRDRDGDGHGDERCEGGFPKFIVHSSCLRYLVCVGRNGNRSS